jgi:hypothetical protein
LDEMMQILIRGGKVVIIFRVAMASILAGSGGKFSKIKRLECCIDDCPIGKLLSIITFFIIVLAIVDRLVCLLRRVGGFASL